MANLGKRLTASLLTISGLASLAYAQGGYLISTYAGGTLAATSAQGTSYPLPYASATTVDAFGNVFVTAFSSCVFRVEPNGLISRYAGTCTAGYSGDGASALAAQLNGPQGLAVDSAGYLYIADVNNNRVRRVAPDGTISTIAGTGVAGFGGDNGPAIAAQLSSPTGVALGLNGQIYIADQANNRVREVLPNGNIITVAGTGAFADTNDGTAAVGAGVSFPNAVVVNSVGELFISNATQIRRVDAAGIITHVAGTNAPGYSGDGGTAATAQFKRHCWHGV